MASDLAPFTEINNKPEGRAEQLGRASGVRRGAVSRARVAKLCAFWLTSKALRFYRYGANERTLAGLHPGMGQLVSAVGGPKRETTF